MNGLIKRSRRSARAAGLVYVDETATAGIQRLRQGRRFCYMAANGHRIRSERTLDRIAALVIPPAWKDVWICSRPDGHLQATGRDQRGRKQYLYHARWREVRDASKFDKMVDFATALPLIRRRVNADLRLPDMPRKKVLAAIIKLLEKTLIRVGNEEYAKANRTFGLTTMRNRHVAVNGTQIRFDFVGKSGIRHEINLRNQRLATIVEQCQELPGQRLFQYTASDGVSRDVSSNDVNQYLREMTGQEFTAKDFRTWGATLLAMRTLQECDKAESMTAKKRNVVQAIKRVAEKLGNTVAVCRKSYVHPLVLHAYLEDSHPESAKSVRRQTVRLSPLERQVLDVLSRKHE